jgi:predicted ATPase
VVVLEDLHWAEPTLLELLRLINEGAAAVPILVLASTRPELAETSRALLQEEANRRVLTLEPLPEDASETILAELLGAEGVAGNPAAAALLRTAGGNPLFLEEIVGMLADVGVVGGDGGGVPEALDDVPVPTSLQALIASRLDQLPVAEKRIAQHASVIGTVFWPGAVAHLDGIEGDLDVGLASLERRDFVHLQQASSVTGEREYVFKHVLTRDVAYGQLPKGRRALLHKRFADWVEALPGGADELVEFVAYHLEQACLLARTVAHPTEPPPIDTAIDALVRAGEKAERREGIREADRFYERALELVDEERRDVVLDLSLRRARLLVTQGYLNEAAARLTEVADAAAELRLRELECSALIALANVDWKQGRATDARARLERAAARAEELADRHLQIRVAYEAAHVTGWFDGAAETIIEALRRPLELAEELRARPLRIEGHMRLGALLLNVGELVEAEEQLRRCIELTSEVGSYRDEARATSMLGFVKYYRGELDEAERLTLQALEWLERTSDSHLQIQNLRFLAKYALARADADLAEQRLREALPLALEAGGWLVIEVYRYLAEALVRQGRLDDARELVAFAARSVPEEDAYARAALLVAEAIVATAGGEQAAASTSFAEALRLLEEQRLWVDLAEARIELARSLQSFGDRAGARTELERVRGALVRMGAGALLAEVAQELPVLTEGTD